MNVVFYNISIAIYNVNIEGCKVRYTLNNKNDGQITCHNDTNELITRATMKRYCQPPALKVLRD